MSHRKNNKLCKIKYIISIVNLVFITKSVNNKAL